MSEAPVPEQTRLIGLDWGTSSLRAYRFAADGSVLERRERALGIASIRNEAFRAAFESTCGDWLRDAPGVAVLACGMIGSRQGWREAPYLPTPAGFDEVATRLLRIDELAGRRFAIVPGVRTENDTGTHDVMRGEETQVFGAQAGAEPAAARSASANGNRPATRGSRHPVAGRFVLPGTHSKWVRVREGRIASFRTYLTGEMFAVLSAHSILGRLFPAIGQGASASVDDVHGNGAARAGFDLGVRRAASDPAGLTALLFSVRSEGLFAALAPEALAPYLSGLLIGAELAHALGRERASTPAGEAVSIIASQSLAARYQRALDLLGQRAVLVAGEPSARGLVSIARAAGLLD